MSPRGAPRGLVLAVHGAGHPHEGHPIEREARCPEVVSKDGECCDVVFEQRMIDPEWLASRPPMQRLAFQEQCPQDADGTIKTRTEQSDLGGTMRLGAQSSDVAKGTLAHKIYGDVVTERHRHRYEANVKYLDQLRQAGLVISALTQREHLTEIVELPQEETNDIRLVMVFDESLPADL